MKKEAKKKPVEEKNLKKLTFYLLHCKKEVILLHPDEKNLKNFNSSNNN